MGRGRPRRVPQAQGPVGGAQGQRRPVPAPPATGTRSRHQRAGGDVRAGRARRAGRESAGTDSASDPVSTAPLDSAERPGDQAELPTQIPAEGLVAGHPPGVQGVVGRQRRDPRRRHRLRGLPRPLPRADRRDQPVRSRRRPGDDRPAGRGGAGGAAGDGPATAPRPDRRADPDPQRRTELQPGRVDSARAVERVGRHEQPDDGDQHRLRRAGEPELPQAPRHGAAAHPRRDRLHAARRWRWSPWCRRC